MLRLLVFLDLVCRLIKYGLLASPRASPLSTFRMSEMRKMPLKGWVFPCGYVLLVRISSNCGVVCTLHTDEPQGSSRMHFARSIFKTGLGWIWRRFWRVRHLVNKHNCISSFRQLHLPGVHKPITAVAQGCVFWLLKLTPRTYLATWLCACLATFPASILATFFANQL